MQYLNKSQKCKALYDIYLPIKFRQPLKTFKSNEIAFKASLEP